MSNGKQLSTGELFIENSKLQQSGLRSTITFNTTGPITDSSRLNTCNSAKNISVKDDEEYLLLQQENNILKMQIKELKAQLKKEKTHKNDVVKECDEQIEKLKKLVEKGYYSIRSLELQKNNAIKQCSKMKANCQFLLNKYKSLQDAKHKVQMSIQNINIKHQEEITLVWERVAHLQNNLQSVVKIMEEDKEFRKQRKNSGLSGSKAFNRKH